MFLRFIYSRKVILIFTCICFHLSCFSQEVITDTTTDGKHKLLLGNDTYIGEINNDNREGAWQLIKNQTVKELYEYKNGICYLVKTKATHSNQFLSSALLNPSSDTLTRYSYDPNDSIVSNRIYLIDKKVIRKNIDLNAEGNYFLGKLLKETTFDYDAFNTNENIVLVTEKENEKTVRLIYYEYLPHEKKLLFKFDNKGHMEYGDHKRYEKLRREYIKTMYPPKK